jgi:hypothetical protein
MKAMVIKEFEHEISKEIGEFLKDLVEKRHQKNAEHYCYRFLVGKKTDRWPASYVYAELWTVYYYVADRTVRIIFPDYQGLVEKIIQFEDFEENLFKIVEKRNAIDKNNTF